MLKRLAITLFIAFVVVLNLFSETEKFRLTYMSGPSAAITIGWNQKSGKEAMVYYGTSDNEKNWSAYPLKASADRIVDYKGMKNCFAHLNGLKSNTIYYFIVKDSEGISNRYSFKTIADSSGERLSIIAGGDTRTDTPVFGDNTCRQRRQNSFKMIAKLRVHFVAFVGDFTFTQSNSDWQEWLDDWQLAISSDGRITPILVTNGNHDSGISLSNLFDTPSVDCYYALSFGGNLLRFYTLNDALTFPGAQTKWLAGDLANGSQNYFWNFVQYHRPMRVHRTSHPNNQNIADYWFPLFAKNKINLVSEGHSHVIKVTWPIINSNEKGSDEGFIRDDAKGIVFIGEGTMGAPLHIPDKNYKWTRNSGSIDAFHWIWLSSSKAEIRTIKYANVDSVGQLNDDTKFSLPQNVDLWKPSNGSVVEINNNKNDVAKKENIKKLITMAEFDKSAKSISVKFSETAGNVLIQLINQQGRIVYSNELTNFREKKYLINATNLPEGIYSLKLFTDEHSEAHQITIGIE